jgi:CheY-like chemotaxis protein
MTAHDPYTDRRPLDLIAVEDSAVDLELELDVLRDAGLVVDVWRVEDEPAFRAALTERLPDAILADWTLPAFSGLSALGIAAECFPGIPVQIVSGTISEATALEALRHGAVDYISKDDLQRLAPSLTRATTVASGARANPMAAPLSGLRCHWHHQANRFHDGRHHEQCHPSGSR